jgi:hypothetical protein
MREVLSWKLSSFSKNTASATLKMAGDILFETLDNFQHSTRVAPGSRSRTFARRAVAVCGPGTSRSPAHK